MSWDESRWLGALTAALPGGERESTQQFLLALVAVLEQLDRWLAPPAPEAPGELRSPSAEERLTLIRRQLRSALLGFGVRPCAAIGMPLDLRRHQIIAEQPMAELPVDTIVSIESGGYLWHDQLLRPARVVIASAPVATGADATATATE